MGKTQRALTSLIAAIPAAVLTYLLVMVFLSRADSLKTISQVIAALTLLCSFGITLMPVALLVLGDRKPKEAADANTSDSDAAVVEDVDELSEASDAEVSAEVDESDADLEEASDFEIGESDADVMSDSSGEMTTGSSVDDLDSVDFEDEDEPKPKKRKK